MTGLQEPLSLSVSFSSSFKLKMLKGSFGGNDRHTSEIFISTSDSRLIEAINAEEVHIAYKAKYWGAS